MYIVQAPWSLVLDSFRVKDTLCHASTPVFSVNTTLLCFFPGHDTSRYQSSSFLSSRPSPCNARLLMHDLFRQSTSSISKTFQNHFSFLFLISVVVSATSSFRTLSVREMHSICRWILWCAASNFYFCVTDWGNSSELWGIVDITCSQDRPNNIWRNGVPMRFPSTTPLVVGWIGSVLWWSGLGWVEEIGPTDNSGQTACRG